jgi:leucine dehydrogenase
MLWTSPEFDDHEQVCLFSDSATGLRAIVAIHSTALGPAVGGTRFRYYGDDNLALDDALRLSRAMSYKSALAGLPCGGGKSVIIGDPDQLKSKPLLHSYGRFINRLGSIFATGEDVGMSLADIETVRDISPFVGGTSSGAGDPSAHTAVGVLHGLRAVLECRFQRDHFRGLSVSVQGLGAVGWDVATRLHAEGAHLTVADIRQENVDRAVAQFGAAVVSPTPFIKRKSTSTRRVLSEESLQNKAPKRYVRALSPAQPIISSHRGKPAKCLPRGESYLRLITSSTLVASSAVSRNYSKCQDGTVLRPHH